MDVFGDLFRGVRAHGSLFGSSSLTAPWALHFVDGAPLTLCTVLGGAGWIVPDDGAPERLGAYETVVVRGPATFTFVDEIGTSAEPVACGEFCATPEHGGTRHRLGWSDDDAGSGATTLIVGAYPVRGEISRQLLDVLPPVLRVEAGGTGDAVLDHLAAEVAMDVPGQQVVLDRLLDWMLVCTLREWFDRPGGRPRRGGPPSVIRSPATRFAFCTATRRHRGRWQRWPTGSGCRGRPWPSGSPSWSANHR
ncbi:hypothetical protein GCM10027535_19840 [Mycolicibacterium hippocampi]|uniref:AraC-type transcription regulator ligand-binding domain-containing protein n=1 Tax=Mycolicibacterium hippocampi TaxID=659824 RepID=A0A7I9ZH40_9MYCO|nr:cupin domain-containing protein [Mycolicibacterium hippocampi]GFH00332.1 hypothetical protein MHIP_08150 [Mycolicibacterium hippocampi]